MIGLCGRMRGFVKLGFCKLERLLVGFVEVLLELCGKVISALLVWRGTYGVTNFGDAAFLGGFVSVLFYEFCFRCRAAWVCGIGLLVGVGCLWCVLLWFCCFVWVTVCLLWVLVGLLGFV